MSAVRLRIGRKPALAVVALTAGAAALAASSPSVARSPGTNGAVIFGGNVDKTRQLFTIRPDGTGMRQLTSLPGENNNGTWSPDNQRVAFERNLPKYAAVYVINADATGLRRVSHSQFASDPAWSPDGRRIVFARENHKPRFETGITLADPDGRHVVKLTRGRFDHPGDFSPDGRHITFVRTGRRGGSAIFVIGVNGRGLTRLTTYAPNYDRPTWSPDGRKILFNSYSDPHPGKSANVFTIRPNGTGLTQLTQITGGEINAFGAQWSPDGTQILYHKAGPGLSDLFLLDADGSNERQLTHLGPMVDPGAVDWGTSQA